MDSVNPGARRTALRQRVDHTQNALQSAASASFLKGDPLAEQLKAMSLAIGVMADLHEASQETQLEIAVTLKNQTDIVTKEAIARVEVSGAELAAKIGPQIAATEEWKMRQQFQILRKRTIFFMATISLGVILVPCAFTYAAGVNVGRIQGEDAANTISAAMRYGPNAAVTWAHLMDLNNPVPEMALCKQSISTTADGRRSCDMPVWLDPPAASAPEQ